MLLKTSLGALSAVLLAASPAFAVTVTNQDSKTHTVVIDHGPSEQQQDVAAGKSLQVSCPDKCGFRDLAFGTGRLAGGDAKLVIDKAGELHFVGGHGDFGLANGKD